MVEGLWKWLKSDVVQTYSARSFTTSASTSPPS
ncbi:hypothetical protein P5G61_00315 [Paenibacillus sp. F6_3S_P_1C]|uniref:Transposase n=1 Tax=Paenibacillus vandeheii TaxID=3035917 RepID=A0ABT8J5V9_9BACL|nr:hypothetical protein [Paenibacillus vandeheii]MDN4599654.1 hypothetical protein [Paenibacillus vandeheii]